MVMHHVTSPILEPDTRVALPPPTSRLPSHLPHLPHRFDITRYGIFVCGMGAVAEFATRSAATLLVVHALRAGPLVGGPIGSFLPLTRARGETT